jgi:hypothetical protein
MKKLFTAGLVASAALALSACGGTKTTTVTSTVQPTSTATTTSAPTTTTTTTPAPGPISKTCSVTGVKNVSPSTVPVQLDANGYPANKAALANCATATYLVNFVANQKAQSPVSTNNFTCTPTVSLGGSKAVFLCSGANNTIKYNFTLNYNLKG